MELFSDQSVTSEVAAFKIFYYVNEKKNGVKHSPQIQKHLVDHVHLESLGDPECQEHQGALEDLGCQEGPEKEERYYHWGAMRW